MPAGSVVSSFRAGESAAVNQAKATTERGAYREDVDSRRRDANLTFPPKRRPLRGNQRENALLHRPRHEPVHDHPPGAPTRASRDAQQAPVLAHQTGDLREGSPGERVLQREHRLRVTTRQLGEDRRRPCRRGPGVAPRSDWRSGARPRAARKQHLADRLGARMRVRNGDAAAIFAKPGTSAPERGRWRIMARSYGRACSAPPGRWIAHPPAASTLERCEGLRSISCPGPCWFHTPGWLPRRCGRDDRRRERRRSWYRAWRPAEPFC